MMARHITGSSLAPGQAGGQANGRSSMYFVYILKSERDGKFYTCLSQDVDARLKVHNKGGNRSTKHRRPFKLIYTEEYGTLEEARKREKYLKSYAGSKEKLHIIKKCRIV